jgi:hypothetical protein
MTNLKYTFSDRGPASQRVNRSTLSGTAWQCERRTLNADSLCIAFIPALRAACRRSASS